MHVVFTLQLCRLFLHILFVCFVSTIINEGSNHKPIFHKALKDGTIVFLLFAFCLFCQWSCTAVASVINCKRNQLHETM